MGLVPDWASTDRCSGDRFDVAPLDETRAWLREQIGEQAENQRAQRGSDTGHEATTGAMAAEGGDDERRATDDLQST
jgi:hypothetical protein